MLVLENHFDIKVDNSGNIRMEIISNRSTTHRTKTTTNDYQLNLVYSFFLNIYLSWEWNIQSFVYQISSKFF